MDIEKALKVVGLPENLLQLPVSDIADIRLGKEDEEIRGILFDVIKKKIHEEKDIDVLIARFEGEDDEVSTLARERIFILLAGYVSIEDLAGLFELDQFKDRCKEIIYKRIEESGLEELHRIESTLEQSEITRFFEDELLSKTEELLRATSHSLESLVNCIIESSGSSQFRHVYDELLIEKIVECDIVDDLIRCHNWAASIFEVKEKVGERLDEILTADYLETLPTQRILHLLSILPVEASRAREALIESLIERGVEVKESKLSKRLLRKLAVTTLQAHFAS